MGLVVACVGGALPSGALAAGNFGDPDTICNARSEFDLVGDGGVRFAETFRVGITGKLTWATMVLLPGGSNPQAYYEVQITRVDASGAPTNAVVASRKVLPNAFESNVSFRNEPPVVAGERYAAVVTRTGSGIDGLAVGLATGPICTGFLWASDSGSAPWSVEPDHLFLVTYVDRPPVVHLLKRPKKRTRKTSAKFTFDAFDNPASLVKFKCGLGRGPLVDCKTTAIYRHLKPGRHLFSVQATDSVANVSDVKSYAWRIKNRPRAARRRS